MLWPRRRQHSGKRFMNRATHIVAGVTLALLATNTAFAAKPDEKPKDDQGSLSIPVTPEQAAAEESEQERANREQADFAARQLADNQAGADAYDREVAEREALIRRQAADHDAAMLNWEADNQRRAREYEESMARWRADVAACQAGEASRCASSAPVPK